MGLNAEINVVSLIDVILLLLLIFMITAPMMMSGINLSLPAVSTPDRISERNPIRIEITRDGKLFVDGKEWSMAQLRSNFRVYSSGKGGQVLIRGDDALNLGRFVEVMDILGDAGVTQYGIGAIKKAG
jgi:biopolymer transport protein ExbD